MSDLIIWLRAHLDADERVAREASGDRWATGASMDYEYSRPGDVYAIAHDGTAARIAIGTRCGPDISAEQSSDHIARHNPARVLAEVDAKRLIIEAERQRAVEDGLPERMVDTFESDVLRLLALPYADRPGYLKEWRP